MSHLIFFSKIFALLFIKSLKIVVTMTVYVIPLYVLMIWGKTINYFLTEPNGESTNAYNSKSADVLQVSTHKE